MATMTPELRALIEACSQPRTMNQLRAELNDMNLEWRVYNAVSRGYLRNMREGASRGTPGLFLKVGADPAQIPAEQGGSAGGLALQHAWSRAR